jgi:Lysylphosphatidylglycerol synthase TM region
MPDSRPRRPLTAVGVLTTAGGVLLLVWWIRRIGVDDIRAGFAQIGWGLAGIVLLGGVRFALRAVAWMLSIEPPHRLRFSDALAAVIAGDALGNLLPLGPLASEPAKAAFVRRVVPLRPAVTALAIENLLYTLSVAAMIAAGMAALLFVFDIPLQLREFGEVAIGGVVITFAVALLLLWRRPALVSRALAALLPGPASDGRVSRVRHIEEEVYTFASRRGAMMVPIVGAELLFHALGVLEAYITLWLLLGAQPRFVIAFIVEAAGRLLTVAFKFVPLQMGVSEAGIAALTGVLGLGTTLGTTLGLVRKVRMLCWTAVGTVLLVRQGVSAATLLTDPQLNQTRE